MIRVAFLFLLFAKAALAQPLVASFSVANAGCTDERLELTNTSAGANFYQWDFCANDIRAFEAELGPVALPGLVNGFGYELVEDQGNWFGFAVSQTGPKLFRLEFGNSPFNTPQVVDMGNPGNSLVFPQDIVVHRNGDNWVGFVGFNDNGYGLVRLNFGSSLQNMPVTENVGSYGVFGRFWDLEIVEQNGDYILVILERNNGVFIRVNYGSSLLNPVNLATQVFVSAAIPSISLAPGFSLINREGEWIALVTSYSTNAIHRVSFGADILGALSAQAVYNLPGVNKPYRVRLQPEGKTFFAVISNELDPITIADFKTLDVSETPEVIAHAGLPPLVGIYPFRFQGKSVIAGVGTANNQFKTLVFQSVCGASQTYSEISQPEWVSYGLEGNKLIELIVTGASGSRSVHSANVVISNLQAPSLEIVTNGQICSESAVEFIAQNQTAGVTSVDWNFGDGNTGTGQTVLHQFAPGDYNVRATATSSNGCTNFFEYFAKIFPPPNAVFEPLAGLICTNNAFTFTNNTVDNFDGNLAYQWFVNDEQVVTDRDMTYTFTSGGDKVIKLVTSIPGCSDEMVQVIPNVGEGPTVGFDMTGTCEEAATVFTNLSAGDIAGYEWNLGGTSSTETNPAITFVDAGDYSINLKATGTNGCISETTKTLTIYSKPQPAFTLDLPPFSCSGSPSQFRDATPVPDDSNLQQWAWTFGDGQAADGKNPTNIFQTAGDYNVSLTVTTDQGCSATAVQSVTIAQSPIVGFETEALCVNQAVRFRDISSGQIKAWGWQIANTTYNVQAPTHVFPFPGTVSASLTVTATNDCMARTSRTITVPEVPTLDFKVEGLCANGKTTFISLAQSPSDPVKAVNWTFADEDVAGEVVSHVFSSQGTLPVGMRVTNESGCTYQLVKNITINPKPVASFTASSNEGAVPLQVAFTNSSVGASQFQWLSNDQVISTDADLVQTFNEVGGYVIDLVAISPEGCTDVFSQQINAIVPRTELALQQFQLLTDNATGALRSQLQIVNNSNYTVRTFDVNVDLGNGTRFRETVNADLPPGTTSTILLSQSLLGVSSGYVCVELAAENDELTFNNAQCTSLQDEPVLFTPYPNPASDYLQFDVVAKNQGVVTMQIIGAAGNKVASQQAVVQPGLNQFSWDIREVNAGLYILIVETGSQRIVRRLVVR
ncbi:MAG: PKD domain-containing protein [Bacteroidota bacterium]